MLLSALQCSISPVAKNKFSMPGGRYSASNRSAFWSHSLIFSILLLSIWLGAPEIIAQVQNGTIQGTAKDTAGASIPEAAVTVTDASTNLVLHGKTNPDGEYSFPQLSPGSYVIAIEKEGFKKTVTTLTLTVGQVAQVDVVVPVGSAAQTVTIDGENTVALDTQTSNLDYTVQSKQVDQLPLNGRNPYGLAVLAPGINAGSNFGVGVAVARGAVVAAATNNFESNGGIGGSNEILLDGISIVVCCQGQPAVTPSAEVIDQFKVVTSNPPAEYGRTSGAVLNIATKSGENNFHGSVYDFLRNDKLDAAGFFTKRDGIYPYPGHRDFRTPHRENQFGAFVAGPVILPHIYHGKDKTFFTFGFEGVRNTDPAVGTTTVPTALMREGIFTEAPAPVYDPNSYNASTGQRIPVPAATCNGATYATGYCIPANKFNHVAVAMLPLVPTPNLPGTINNYRYVENVTDSDDQFNFRVDHNFSDKQRTFIRGTRDTNKHLNYDLFNEPNGPNGAWQQQLTAYLFAIGHLWTMSSSTLVQFSYGFARQTNYQLPSVFQYDAADYGFSNQFTAVQQEKGMPTASFTDLQQIGWGDYFNKWAHNAHMLNASVLLQRSKHSVAIGYNGQLILENQGSAPGGTEGGFTFATQYTNGPSPNGAIPTGQGSFDSWASFLLGYPTSGNVSRNVTTAFQQWVTGLYVQDDWRLTPHLTLNLGLRWDIETGFKERYNRWADFSPAITNPLSSAVGFELSGGAQFLGVNGNPSRTWPTYYREFGPRLGFSYAATDATVFRGGYGILYLPSSQRGYSDPNIGFSQSTNISTSANGFTPVITTDNPFPNGVLLPAGSSAGAGVSAGTSISGFQYDNPMSYQQQWNFGVEQSISRTMTFNVNYVGGHGVDLPLNPRPNDLQPQYFGKPGDTAYVSYLQAQVPNPFYGASGLAPGSLLLNPTVQRVQLAAAFPQYTSGSISSIQNGSVGIVYLNHGSASYNALQATLLVHSQSGLIGSVSYVWSKLLGNVSDITNGFLNPTGNPGVQDYYFLRQYERSNLATDLTHHIVGTATYPLPVGHGKTFGGNMPGWANGIAGGWTVTTIVGVSSGFPISTSVTGAPAFAGSRPMYVSAVAPLTEGSTRHRLGGVGQSQGYLNPAAFSRPLSFQLGDVPRSAAGLRGPLSFDDNVSLIKYLPIYENLSLEFRGDAFNVLNKAAFSMPNATVGSAMFGYITSQANSPRNIQLSMKLHF